MSKEKNQLTELIRPHTQKIGEDAAKGNLTAKQLIDLYRMHCQCPSDPHAATLCEIVFAVWMGGGE